MNLYFDIGFLKFQFLYDNILKKYNFDRHLSGRHLICKATCFNKMHFPRKGDSGMLRDLYNVLKTK